MRTSKTKHRDSRACALLSTKNQRPEERHAEAREPALLGVDGGGDGDGGSGGPESKRSPGSTEPTGAAPAVPLPLPLRESLKDQERSFCH